MSAMIPLALACASVCQGSDRGGTLSEWWKLVLGYIDVPGDPNEPGDEQCYILDQETGHVLLVIEVDELRAPDGRIHLDLGPTDRRRDEEVEWVLGLGATQVDDFRNPGGTGWVVLRLSRSPLKRVLHSRRAGWHAPRDRQVSAQPATAGVRRGSRS